MPTPGPFLRDIMREVAIPPGSCILDLGCGKGAAMHEFLRMPFAEVADVEISEPVAEIARENFRKLGLAPPTIQVENALEFTDYDRFTHIYLYNPFPAPIIAAVIANLQASLARAPRKLTVIYYNPLHTDALVASGTFHLKATVVSPLVAAFDILET
jgi:tRNA A58 N-methylase Trm61